MEITEKNICEVSAVLADIDAEIWGSRSPEKEYHDDARRILSALSPAPEPEPVAWRDPKSFGDEDGFLRVRVSGPSGVETQPLFTAPPSAERMREALEPFALMASEGVVKTESGYVTVTTQAEYFHRALAALADQKGGEA